MNLPRFKNYGEYSSENYGAHSLKFSIGGFTVWFSYKTPVAFYSISTGFVIRENEWGATTGKHLNLIDPDHKKRIPGVKFEEMLSKLIEQP